jgi:hypothetical protein
MSHCDLTRRGFAKGGPELIGSADVVDLMNQTFAPYSSA